MLFRSPKVEAPEIKEPVVPPGGVKLDTGDAGSETPGIEGPKLDEEKIKQLEEALKEGPKELLSRVKAVGASIDYAELIIPEGEGASSVSFTLTVAAPETVSLKGEDAVAVAISENGVLLTGVLCTPDPLSGNSVTAACRGALGAFPLLQGEVMEAVAALSATAVEGQAAPEGMVESPITAEVVVGAVTIEMPVQMLPVMVKADAATAEKLKKEAEEAKKSEEELAAEEEAKRAQEEMQARMTQQSKPLGLFDRVVRAVEEFLGVKPDLQKGPLKAPPALSQEELSRMQAEQAARDAAAAAEKALADDLKAGPSVGAAAGGIELPKLINWGKPRSAVQAGLTFSLSSPMAEVMDPDLDGVPSTGLITLGASDSAGFCRGGLDARIGSQVMLAYDPLSPDKLFHNFNFGCSDNCSVNPNGVYVPSEQASRGCLKQPALLATSPKYRLAYDSSRMGEEWEPLVELPEWVGQGGTSFWSGSFDELRPELLPADTGEKKQRWSKLLANRELISASFINSPAEMSSL